MPDSYAVEERIDYLIGEAAYRPWNRPEHHEIIAYIRQLRAQKENDVR